MDERHAAETAALEQRERDAAGPQEETTDILATDLYSFSLPAAETQKQVGHTCTVESVHFLHYGAVLCCAVLCCAVLCWPGTLRARPIQPSSTDSPSVRHCSDSDVFKHSLECSSASVQQHSVANISTRSRCILHSHIQHTPSQDDQQLIYVPLW